MKKDFKLLRTAIVEAADTFGVVLDDSFSVHSEGYEFERYKWVLTQSGKYPGMEIRISVSGNDLDQHFYGSPTGHDGKRPQLFKHLCDTRPKNPIPLTDIQLVKKRTDAEGGPL